MGKKFTQQIDQIKTRLSQSQRLSDLDKMKSNENKSKIDKEEDEGDETQPSVDESNGDTFEFMEEQIKQSDDEFDDASDTTKIERAVGQIEVNYNEKLKNEEEENQNAEQKSTAPQIVIADEKSSPEKMIENVLPNPVPKSKLKNVSKLKRSFFRARTSKNRLLKFSSLDIASPEKQNDDPMEPMNSVSDKPAKIENYKQVEKEQPDEQESSDDGFDDDVF